MDNENVEYIENILDKELEDVLENADKEFREVQEGAETIGEFDDTPSKSGKIQKYQDILIALGFIRYDNGEKGIAYKLHVGSLQIGRTFTEKIPVGTMWVKCLVDCEHGKKGKFLKKGQLKEIPQVALFYHIRDGELSMPASDVMGNIVGKSEKAIQVVFDEFEESRTEWWSLKVLKRNEERITYVPASYSKQTENYAAKMQVPRDILLVDYEEELGKVPLTVSAPNVPTEKHTEKVEKSTLADTIHTPVAVKDGEGAIETIMHHYLKEGRKMVEDVFPELEQPQLSEIAQDVATSLFIEHSKQSRKEKW